ncbi:pseudouridine synthase [Luteimonas terrae]|uniref:tRNA pseudouridine32 synthase/23S rRNA pseudouridine746 synthase n=1 Tax=Luteimonas terrae TaxID=1530191 RepID=A0ABU1XWV2_9GAMM|nr:pseudouridine synthase [Luteimonas terrae]MDR7193242.1 tRNA pseudouridine32 synthase/23S rRNA pseudouridine746 synthase [Luteimonas terrae]
MSRPRFPPRDGVPASRLQLPPGAWRTVFDALVARFPQVDASTWRNRIARGRVLDARGEPITLETPHRVGAEIGYYREVVDEPVIDALERVLHVDDHLVVADKPHGLPVAPTGAFVTQTLLTRLVATLGNPDLVPLHRIDRGTAGLVLFSASPASRARYQALFRESRIAKTYEALAPPLPDIAFPLTRRSRIERGEPFFRMCEIGGALNSETHIDVLERGSTRWRYALSPVSGRKHQLRVHMAALGAPILHDPWYPTLQGDADETRPPLQLLARALAFDDPLDGCPRRFESEFRLVEALD